MDQKAFVNIVKNQPIPELLAKSITRDGRKITLFQHTQDLYQDAQTIFGSPAQPTAFCNKWLRFFRIQPDQADLFIRSLLTACVFHDLGKANEHFIRAVTGKSPKQAIRHEHLSLFLLLYKNPISIFFQSIQGVDQTAVLAAVVSHHLKADYETVGAYLNNLSDDIVLPIGSPQIIECLQLIGNLASMSLNEVRAGLTNKTWRWNQDDIHGLQTIARNKAMEVEQKLLNDPAALRHTLAVKAALIVVDAVASAMTRVNISHQEWLTKTLLDPQPRLTGQVIRDAIIAANLNAPLAEGKPAHQLWAFQQQVIAAGDLVLGITGCGSGKTNMSWVWLAEQVDKYNLTRVAFLFPTRGTATENFKDYSSNAGGEFATLIHSAANYELEGMFENPSDGTKDWRQEEDYRCQDTLFALGLWTKQIFTATVDTFLPFMGNSYKSMCLLPLLVDSAQCYDEVHSYDKVMFSAFERYAKFFKTSILAMSATVQTDRQAILLNSGFQVYPGPQDNFPELKIMMDYPRYRIFAIEKFHKALARVVKAIKAGKKVLWICNSVIRAQAMATFLRSWIKQETGLDLPMPCYHRRFVDQHRKTIHAYVVEVFKPKTTGPQAATTTQVCEMSLDIDADLIVTEIAPLWPTIQRCGRAARHAGPNNPKIAEIIVFWPYPTLPYRDPRYLPYAENESLQTWAMALHFQKMQRPISQQELLDYCQNQPILNPLPENAFSGFLDSPFWASHTPFRTTREEGGQEVECILDKDVDRFLQLIHSDNGTERLQARGLIIPVLNRYLDPESMLDDRLLAHNKTKYMRVVPASQYSDINGFTSNPDKYNTYLAMLQEAAQESVTSKIAAASTIAT